MRTPLRVALIVFVAAWIPATVVLGVRWGQRLRIGTERASD